MYKRLTTISIFVYCIIFLSISLSSIVLGEEATVPIALDNPVESEIAPIEPEPSQDLQTQPVESAPVQLIAPVQPVQPVVRQVTQPARPQINRVATPASAPATTTRNASTKKQKTPLVVVVVKSNVSKDKLERPTSNNLRAANPNSSSRPKPASTANSNDDFGALNVHNSYRSTVGVAPLQWSPSLAASASAAAWSQAQHGCNYMKHTRSGENIFHTRGATSNARLMEEAVHSFCSANEQRQYQTYHAMNHYSQVVWKGTSKVGCAVANAGGCAWVVCHYDPPGNYLGQLAF